MNSAQMFSEEELAQLWNQQADEFNQWDSLGSSEQLAWAQARALQSVEPAPLADEGLAGLVSQVEVFAVQHDQGTPEKRLLERVATVLRQQQAEIERLETPPLDEGLAKLIDRLGWIAAQLGALGWKDDDATVVESASLLQRQQARIIELEKRLDGRETNPKSEPNPIAWCNKEDLENALIKNQSFSGWREKYQDCDTPLFFLDAVLRCKEQIAQSARYEFSILDTDGCEQAGGSAPTYEQALAEGRHYLSQYLQDGPYKLIIREHRARTIQEITGG